VLGILESEKEMVNITVTYIDHMGSDLSVVNAARVSFGKQSEWEWEECGVKAFGNESYQRLSDRDTKLIKYLAKHKHISPFGHAFASFHVCAPVFVARQLVKHKFLRWNEVSRRYVDDEPEFYVPDQWRGRSADKKQGSDGVVTTSCVHDMSGELTHPKFAAQDVHEVSLHIYNGMLAAGVAPEQARMVLPQSMMTEWYWSGSLDAFADMCNLRCKPDTQYESQIVANQISEAMGKLFPVSWAALTGADDA
jgi:thymidylate synthase (FAD)